MWLEVGGSTVNIEMHSSEVGIFRAREARYSAQSANQRRSCLISCHKLSSERKFLTEQCAPKGWVARQKLVHIDWQSPINTYIQRLSMKITWSEDKQAPKAQVESAS